jgi:glucokinase
MGDFFVGVDIGGTNVKVGLFDEGMKLVSKDSVPTNADMGPEYVVEQIGITAKGLLEKAGIGLNDTAGVGIGTPGPADYPNGIVIRSTNMPKFKDTHLRDMVSKVLESPSILENDANVACWGEFSVGVGKDINDMIFFTLGTGIGGGIVCRGELVTGSNYNAAELGHVIIYPDGRLCGCGQKGCVEAYASANSTAKRAQEAVEAGEESSLKDVLEKSGQITCKDVFEHSAAGDKLAKKITEGTAKALAVMCINMLHTTEPERIVFSGGVIAAGEPLLEAIKRHFDEMIWKIKSETVEICFATLGEDTGIIGAAALAKHAKEQGKLK